MHYLDHFGTLSPPSSSPRKNRWTHEIEIGIPPKKTIIYSQKYLHRDSWLISPALKENTKPRCVLVGACYNHPLQAGAVGKNAAISRPWIWWSVVVWCGWWNRRWKHLGFGCPQKIEVCRASEFFGEISWFIQLDSWFFKTIHLLEGVWNSGKIPPNFSKLQWRTPDEKTDNRCWSLQRWPWTWVPANERDPRYNHHHQNQYIFKDFLKGFRHPKLSSLEKRHPGKSSCGGYSQWMWCTCECTITS